MKKLVVNWLDAGAPFTQGARLFSLLAGRDHPFTRILERQNKTVHLVLKCALQMRVALPPAASGLVVIQQPAAPKPNQVKLREDWPFLQYPGCPPELKILAANKITAYHNYVAAHDHLFDCSTPEEGLRTVTALVENYIENRKIIGEFRHYKEHGHVLGSHPIFNEFKQIKALRKLNIVDLLKLHDKLQHNIWRIESELKKGDKKHLAIERERRLQEKRNLLAEVNRLVDEYNRT